MRWLRAVGLTLSVITLPALSLAQNPRTFKDLADQLATIMNWGVTLLITAGIVIYFWGAVKQILDRGESEDSQEMRKFLFTGLIVIFVMVSIWGILGLLQNTLFQGGSSLAL